MIKKFINSDSLIKTKTVKIGEGTRINGKILIHGKEPVQIGKYCAFGYGIKIISTNHKTSHANQQLYLQKFIGAKELEYTKSKNKFSVSVGNNVWIGNNVLITSNVNIGDGAVIGAGSVVTKDIEAFSINVGNPYKKIKYRFKKKIIEYLKKISWWDWSFKKIKKNKSLFDLNFEKINVAELKKIKIV